MQLALTGVGKLHFIQVGPGLLDLTSLAADLTPTATVAGLAATGQYDSTANTFMAGRLPY